MIRLNISPAAVQAESERLQALLAAPRESASGSDRSTTRLPLEGKACLRYYPPLRESSARPLLLVYSLVNRPQILDRIPGGSFIESLQRLGHPVYLVDWGRPDASDAGLSLADYVCGYLHAALDCVRQHRPARTLDVIGICQGGTLALCLASLEPRRVHSLVTLVTPVNFHTPGDVLAELAKAVDLPSLLATDGNLPGRLLGGLFSVLRPLRGNDAARMPLLGVLAGSDPEPRERFLNLLAWQADYPDQAGRAWLEFATWCYRENRLLAGTLCLDAHRIDLRRLRMPILNVYARADHLVPPAAARALGGTVGSLHYRELAVEGGHVGVFAGRRNLAVVPSAISEFLGSRGNKKPR